MHSDRKTALITGSGQNIGRGIASQLAQAGFNIIVNGSSNRDAAEAVAAEMRNHGVEALVAMGNVGIKAEAEGIRGIFETAGFQWRPEAGCSMCLAMNDDIAMDGERVASSTNRNFEGRQGRGARTHLMSPAMVAAAAVAGHPADVRDFK